MPPLIDITKALSERTRLRLLQTLRGRELCACQLTEMFGLAASTMSKHMNLLCRAGLVVARKDGRWTHYSLAGEDAPQVVRSALELVHSAMADSEETREDAQRLKEVLKIEPTELCRRQCRP